MSQLIVISAVGKDRKGVVQDITKAILSCGGNIEESRMTTLAAEFAMLMLVSGSWHTLSRLETKLEKLTANDNLTVAIRKTSERASKEDRMPYAVDVVSLDQHHQATEHQPSRVICDRSHPCARAHCCRAAGDGRMQ